MTEILSKTWILDYGLLNGGKIQGLEIVDDEYIFELNHTYKLISADSSFITGDWIFNQDKKQIELYSKEGNSSGYIIAIEKDKLILIPGEKSVPEVFKMEFFFKPKL